MSRVRLVVLAVVLLIAGCGSSSKTASSPTSTTKPPGPSGSINVFAAASLTESFNATKLQGVNVKYNFAGSQTLVQQIQNGAPGDVFASADQKNMQKLETAGLV